MGVRISLDYFPAKVTLPDGTGLRPTRVFIVDDVAEVYAVVGGKPRLYWSSPVQSVEGTRRRGYAIQTNTGELTVVDVRGDCGCGNPLRSFNPWPGERRHLVPL